MLVRLRGQRRCSPTAGSGASLSLPALAEYLTFQNVFGERTLFEGVEMLPAGTSMRVSRDGGVSRRTYFDPVPEPIEGVDESALSDELRGRLARAVERQLMADVPVGAYLSGGMDSASLVTLAGRLHTAHPHFHRRLRRRGRLAARGGR